MSPSGARPRHALAAVVALAAAGAACGDRAAAPAPVARVELSSSAVALVAGGDAPLTARLLDADGRELTGRAVVWTTRDAAVADVAPSSGLTGIVRGRAPGVTEVAANAEGRFAVVAVSVSPRGVATLVAEPSALDLRVGGARQLQVRALDAAGAELAGRPVTFASSDTAVARVSEAGLVTAAGPGGATITVASEGRTTLVAVTVTPVPVATVVVGPTAPSVVVGGSVQLTVAALDSAGRPLADRPTTWTSSDDAVARVSAAGVATGVRAGTARISAVVEGRTAAVTLTVVPRAVAAVAVTAPRATLTVGDTVRLAARATDAAGNVLVDRPVAWESDAPAVAVVSAAGLVTARAPGAATLAATIDGVRGTLALRVVAVPVASVQVTPQTLDLLVGRTARLAAVPRAADGTALAGPVVAWTSGAPGVATVAADGTVTAVAPGTAVVFAQAEGVTGQATVTVRQVAVDRVVVAPSTVALRVGAAADLGATLYDAAGGVVTGRVVVWTSSDETVAVVSSAGRVVAVRAGTATITATVDGGARGTAAVTVAPALAGAASPTHSSPHAGSP